MAANDEVIRLVLETLGKEGVEAMTKDLDQQKNAMQALALSYKNGELSLQDFTKQAGTLDGQIRQSSEILNAMTGKPGSGRNPGQGLLGASYAVQDFTSQLGTRGLVGALGAIQNNIPQILSSLGVGAGLTGVISIAAVAIGALLPLIQKAFGGETQEMIEAAKKKLEEFQAEIKKTHDAFLAMANKATPEEEEEAANLKAIFDARPTAEKLKKAVAAGASRQTVEKEMTAEEMAEIGSLRGAAGMTDADIRTQASTWSQAAGAAILDPAKQQQLRFARDQAQQRQFAIEKAIRERIGEKLLKGAVVPGPDGREARRRLTEYAPDDIKREIRGASVGAQQESDQADEAFNQQLAERSEAVKRRNANQKQRRTSNEAAAQGEDDARRATLEIQAAERRDADKAARDAEQALRDELTATKAMLREAKGMTGSKEYQEAQWRQQQINGMRQMGMNEGSIAKQMQQMKQLNRQLEQVGRQLGRTGANNGP